MFKKKKHVLEIMPPEPSSTSTLYTLGSLVCPDFISLLWTDVFLAWLRLYLSLPKFHSY